MNMLKVHTCPTAQADIFWVYWTNSLLRPKGLLKVRVSAPIADRQIAAELVAMQHLLEDKAVVGQNIVGNAGTHLIVSLGAIRKLHRSQSDKAHLAPYANFMTTRFAGCQVSVDKDGRWFDGYQPEVIEDLLVSGPRREKMLIKGLGEVSITQHVLERFADRVLADNAPDIIAQRAWKRLYDLVTDRSVREVFRQSLWAGANHCQLGKQEGRYFLNPKRNLVMVVTDNPHEGKRLVTTYPATHHFQNNKIAA